MKSEGRLMPNRKSRWIIEFSALNTRMNVNARVRGENANFLSLSHLHIDA